VASRKNGKTVLRQCVIARSSDRPMDVDVWCGAGFILMDSPRTSLLDVLKQPRSAHVGDMDFGGVPQRPVGSSQHARSQHRRLSRT
jgi:hypothetical protein